MGSRKKRGRSRTKIAKLNLIAARKRKREVDVEEKPSVDVEDEPSPILSDVSDSEQPESTSRNLNQQRHASDTARMEDGDNAVNTDINVSTPNATHGTDNTDIRVSAPTTLSEPKKLKRINQPKHTAVTTFDDFFQKSQANQQKLNSLSKSKEAPISTQKLQEHEKKLGFNELSRRNQAALPQKAPVRPTTGRPRLDETAILKNSLKRRKKREEAKEAKLANDTQSMRLFGSSCKTHDPRNMPKRKQRRLRFWSKDEVLDQVNKLQIFKNQHYDKMKKYLRSTKTGYSAEKKHFGKEYGSIAERTNQVLDFLKTWYRDHGKTTVIKIANEWAKIQHVGDEQKHAARVNKDATHHVSLNVCVLRTILINLLIYGRVHVPGDETCASYNGEMREVQKNWRYRAFPYGLVRRSSSNFVYSRDARKPTVMV